MIIVSTVEIIQSGLKYIKETFELDPEISILVIICLLSGYMIYFHLSKKLAKKYTSKNKLEIWDTIIWIIIFSISNLVYCFYILFLLALLVGIIIPNSVIITFTDDFLFTFFFLCLLIIPASLYVPKINAPKLLRVEIIMMTNFVIILGFGLVWAYHIVDYVNKYQKPFFKNWFTLIIFITLLFGLFINYRLGRWRIKIMGDIKSN